MATKTAVAGEFESRGGEDFVHYKNSKGEMMASIDGTGAIQVTGLTFPDGSYQNRAASVTGSSIDSGTF